MLSGECILVVEGEERRLQAVGLLPLPARHRPHHDRRRRRAVRDRSCSARRQRRRSACIRLRPRTRAGVRQSRRCRGRRSRRDSAAARATRYARPGPRRYDRRVSGCPWPRNLTTSSTSARVVRTAPNGVDVRPAARSSFHVPSTQAVDDERRGQDPAARPDRLVVLARRTISARSRWPSRHAVERRQQAHVRRRRLEPARDPGRAGRGPRPPRARARGVGAARLAHRQARPDREVLRRGRRVRAGVAAGELDDRVRSGAGRPGRASRRSARTRVGRPLDDRRPAARRTPVSQAGTCGWSGELDAGAAHGVGELAAGERAVGQRRADRGGRRRSDAQLRDPPRARAQPDRPEQRDHPARVLGRDQVQRPAHAPRSGRPSAPRSARLDSPSVPPGRRARTPSAAAAASCACKPRPPHRVRDGLRRPGQTAARGRADPRARSGGRVRGTAKRSPMSSLQASRTLVKSPPELWAELSDLGSLARHLGEFGEIRITQVDPESRVEWEADRASGTVRLEPSGWGTRVVLTVDTPEPAALARAGARAERRPSRRWRARARAGAASRRAGTASPSAAARAEARLLGPPVRPHAAVAVGADAGARRGRARAGARSPLEPEAAESRVRHDRVGDPAEPVAEEPEPEPDRPPSTPTRCSPACSTPSAPRTTGPSAAPNTLRLPPPNLDRVRRPSRPRCRRSVRARPDAGRRP